MTPEDSLVDENGQHPTRSIYVRRIPSGATGAIIKAKFNRYGAIESVSPGTFSKTVKGRAFVNFYDTASAVRAVLDAHNTSVFVPDDTVLVTFATPQTELKPRPLLELATPASSPRGEWFIERNVPTGPKINPREPPIVSLRAPVSPPRDRHAEFGRQFDSYRPRRQFSSPEPESRRVYDTYRPEDAGGHGSGGVMTEGLAQARGVYTTTQRESRRAEHQDKARAELVNTQIQELKARVAPLREGISRGTLYLDDGLTASRFTSARFTTPNSSLNGDGRPIRSSIPYIITEKPSTQSVPEPPLQASSSTSPLERGQSPVGAGSHALLRVRVSGTDDSVSITSSSTRLSIRKSQCADCKGPETSLRPYTTCATCERRYHSSCGAPSPSTVLKETAFVCGRCLRAGRKETSVPSVPIDSRPMAAATFEDMPKQGSHDFGPPKFSSETRGLEAATSIAESEPDVPHGPLNNSIGKNVGQLQNPAVTVKLPLLVNEIRGSESPRSLRIQNAAAETVRRYKQITCPQWLHRRNCRYLDAADCMFAHCDTGVYAPYDNKPAKQFTCYDWKTYGNCPSGPQCSFSHEDTGLYVNSKWKASMKHITCKFWRETGKCRHSENRCTHAHADTGVYSNSPSSVELSAMSIGRTKANRQQDDSAIDLNVDFSAIGRRVYSRLLDEAQGTRTSLEQRADPAKTYGQLNLSPLSPSQNQQLQYGFDTPYSPVESEDAYSPRCDSPVSAMISFADHQDDLDSQTQGQAALTVVTRDMNLPLNPPPCVTATTDSTSTLPPTLDAEKQGITAPKRHFAKRTVVRAGDPRKRRHDARIRRPSESAENTTSKLAELSTCKGDISKMAENQARSCRGCGKRLFGSVERCSKCQEQCEQPLPVHTQMPTPAESPVAGDGRGESHDTVDGTPFDLFPTLDGDKTAKVPTVDDEDAEESTRVSCQPLQQTPKIEHQAIAGTKRPLNPAPFIVTKKQKIDLTRAKERVDSSRNELPKKPTLEALIDEARMQKAATSIQARSEDQDVRVTKTGKEILHPSTSPLSDGIEVLPFSANRIGNSIHASPRLLRQVTDGESDEAQQAQATNIVQQSRPPSTSTLLSTHKRCARCACKRTHKRCFHDQDGSLDAKLCREYLEEHVGKTARQLNITRALFLQLHQAAGIRQGSSENEEDNDDNQSDDSDDGVNEDVSSLSSVSLQYEEIDYPSTDESENISQAGRKCAMAADTSARVARGLDSSDERRDLNVPSTLEASPRRVIQDKVKDTAVDDSENDKDDDLSLMGAGLTKILSTLNSFQPKHPFAVPSPTITSCAKENSTPTLQQAQIAAPECMPAAKALRQSPLQIQKQAYKPPQQSPALRQPTESAPQKAVQLPQEAFIPPGKTLKSQFLPHSTDAKKSPGSKAKSVQSTVANRKAHNNTAHLAKLKAMGVRIDEDSDEEMSDAEETILTPVKASPRRNAPFGVKVSRDLFEVAPNLRPDSRAPSKPKFDVPGQPLPSRKSIWKNLVAYQCRERKERFGNPHQAVEAPTVPERMIKANIQVSVPDSSGMPGRTSVFHVDPVELKKVSMPFREFLGAPKEPIIERDGADLVFVEGQQNRERRELGLRRFAGVEKFPFIRN